MSSHFRQRLVVYFINERSVVDPPSKNLLLTIGQVHVGLVFLASGHELVFVNIQIDPDHHLTVCGISGNQSWEFFPAFSAFQKIGY